MKFYAKTFKPEYFFKITAIILVVLLVFSQVALSLPSLRMYFTDAESISTVYNEADEEKGEITLRIEGTVPDDNIKILADGDVVGSFAGKEITVCVDDNTVLEIDGRKTKRSFVVKMVKKSSNIKEFGFNELKVNGNIAFLGRIFLK